METVTMSRVFNFSPGPAMLPEAVMARAQSEFMNWQQSGSSVMELSHRSAEFIALAESVELKLRQLLTVPDDYHVLFLHGGARGQFSAIPMNLMGDASHAAYVVTGIWGQQAHQEAESLCKTSVIASTQSSQFTHIPDQSTWLPAGEAAYCHFVDNETVNGVEFPVRPTSLGVPWVADMSSNLLTRPVSVADYGLIYACAQKNLAPAGITVVIVKSSLLERRPMSFMPTIFDYRLQAKKGSMVNTPATFPWYMLGLVCDWVVAEGGVAAMDQRARARSEPIYAYLDATDFYRCPVAAPARSRMNVVFRCPDADLDALFVKAAATEGMTGLKGHRVVGGIRASMYNAMPQAGADQLLEFMKTFAQRYG